MPNLDIVTPKLLRRNPLSIQWKSTLLKPNQVELVHEVFLKMPEEV